MEAKLNPKKFEEMIAPLYEHIKETKAQIKAIALQAKDECYEILSKNHKGNCILLTPNTDEVAFYEGGYFWAIGAFDGTIQVQACGEYSDPEPDDKFKPTCEPWRDKYIYPYEEESFLEIYAAVIKNLDKAMPREEAEQYYPKWSDEADQWVFVKK